MKPQFPFDPAQQPDKRNVSFASRKLALLPPIKLKDFVAPAETIIFTHIPKTGGTNLRFITEALSIIRQAFKATRFAVPRIPNYSSGVTYDGWIGGFKSAFWIT